MIHATPIQERADFTGLEIIRTDHDDGVETIVSPSRAGDVIGVHYRNSDEVLCSLAAGVPVRTPFATFSVRNVA